MANQPISIDAITEGARQAESLAKNLREAANKIKALGNNLPTSPLVLHGGDYLINKLPLLYRWSAKFPGQLQQAIEDAFALDANINAAVVASESGQSIETPPIPFKGEPPKKTGKRGA